MNFVILTILLSIIASILFGSLIKYHFDGGQKYSNIRKVCIFLANIPMNLNKMFRSRSLNPSKPAILLKHKSKKRFEQFIPNLREGLLILPRYDHAKSKPVVEIIDLKNFKVIHTYAHDISRMRKNKSMKLEYYHPLVMEDGSLISEGTNTPLFKIDLHSNLEWINDEVVFHHTKILDFEANIWTGGKLKPFSRILSNF